MQLTHNATQLDHSTHHQRRHATSPPPPLRDSQTFTSVSEIEKFYLEGQPLVLTMQILFSYFIYMTGGQKYIGINTCLVIATSHKRKMELNKQRADSKCDREPHDKFALRKGQ